MAQLNLIDQWSTALHSSIGNRDLYILVRYMLGHHALKIVGNFSAFLGRHEHYDFRKKKHLQVIDLTSV